MEAVLVGLEDELAALDLRHAALLHAADEQVACGDGGAACTVRPVSSETRKQRRQGVQRRCLAAPAGAQV